MIGTATGPVLRADSGVLILVLVPYPYLPETGGKARRAGIAWRDASWDTWLAGMATPPIEFPTCFGAVGTVWAASEMELQRFRIPPHKHLEHKHKHLEHQHLQHKLVD
jgi:hypothetical protein